jgi:hypothetical protein
MKENNYETFRLNNEYFPMNIQILKIFSFNLKHSFNCFCKSIWFIPLGIPNDLPSVGKNALSGMCSVL